MAVTKNNETHHILKKKREKKNRDCYVRLSLTNPVQCYTGNCYKLVSDKI